MPLMPAGVRGDTDEVGNVEYVGEGVLGCCRRASGGVGVIIVVLVLLVVMLVLGSLVSCWCWRLGGGPTRCQIRGWTCSKNGPDSWQIII